MKLPRIDKTIRNTKRLAEIIHVLIRFGFKEVVAETGIHKLAGSGKDISTEEQEPRYATLPKSQRVRLVLEELGATFIKLGQTLSTRPDLIPPEWADEFKGLQSDCPKVEFSLIEEILNKEFPGRLQNLFSSIDKNPLAAASIAQVHRAKLTTGEQVVLKILRPGIRNQIEEDMALMETLAQFMEQYFSNLGYSPVMVAKEFSREILKEVNLIYEGQSTERLRRYFEDDSHIHFPKVFWDTSTRNILTLEEIHGKLLSGVNPCELTNEQRRSIVSHGTDAVFKQCLHFGFFHADPHPGNIFLRPDNSLSFIDCGMTGHLDKKTTELLIDLVAGIIKGDIEKLCRVVIQLTDTSPSITDRRDFRGDLHHITSRFKDCELKQIDITSLLSEFFGILQRYSIRCPADLLLLTKAMTTIKQIAEDFDPTFDVLAHVEPQISEIVMARYGFKGIRHRLQKSSTEYLELLEDLPGNIQRFLDHIRQSRFTLNLELKRIEHLAEKMDSSSRMMGMAMIISALIVGSSILILADAIIREESMLGHLGIGGLILSAVYSVGFIGSFLLPRKRNK